MKNLKRSLAVFVSAIMVMAMLAGCGSSSIGSQLRDKTGAGVSTAANSVAITLADKGKVTESTVESAVKNVIGEDEDVTMDTDTDYIVAIVDDGDDITGLYFAFDVTYTSDTALVAAVNEKFESIKTTFGLETKDMYIAASAIDADAGTYAIVIYVDYADYN